MISSAIASPSNHAALPSRTSQSRQKHKFCVKHLHPQQKACIWSIHDLLGLVSVLSEPDTAILRYHPADLGPGGEIIFEGQQFKSPSAFSVHVKRKQNPGRKADDGWYA